MTKRCLDEAIIQAYLDGELSTDVTREALAHFAACDDCANALTLAEADSVFFAEAFGPDDSLAVPSEVLRANVNAAVARLESAEGARVPRTGWNFSAVLAPLAGLFSLNPQRAAAFASVLAVVAFAAIFFFVQRRTPQPPNAPSNEIAQHERAEPSQPTPPPGSQTGTGNLSGDGVEPTPVPSPVEIVKAAGTPTFKVRNATAPRRVPKSETTSEPKAEEVLPGEKNYRQAIASLEQTIKMGGEAVLRPSVHAEYERSLAVINKAIEQTRGVARSNPKDKDAVGFLMAAYQSKVELLSTVADQAQVATLGR